MVVDGPPVGLIVVRAAGHSVPLSLNARTIVLADGRRIYRRTIVLVKSLLDDASLARGVAPAHAPINGVTTATWPLRRPRSTHARKVRVRSLLLRSPTTSIITTRWLAGGIGYSGNQPSRATSGGFDGIPAARICVLPQDI